MGVKNPGQLSALPDIQVVVKTANEIVNNSAVLQDDNQLFFDIGASETWFVEYHLLTESAANADFKESIVGPAGSNVYASGVGKDVTGTVQADTGELSWAGGIGKALNPHVLKAIIVNGATAGHVTLQWAQATAQLSDTTVYLKSFLIAFRIS